MTIEGIMFRFIDTAGLRTTTDVIEKIGVDKAYQVMKKSAIVIYLFDVQELSGGELQMELELLRPHIGTSQLLVVGNKTEHADESDLRGEFAELAEIVFISAREEKNIDALKKQLVRLFDLRAVHASETVVTNARHADSLKKAAEALLKVSEGLDSSVPGDLLALDIRYALNELGNITGEVSSDDLLENIFTRFCIGK